MLLWLYLESTIVICIKWFHKLSFGDVLFGYVFLHYTFTFIVTYT